MNIPYPANENYSEAEILRRCADDAIRFQYGHAPRSLLVIDQLVADSSPAFQRAVQQMSAGVLVL